MTTLAAFDVQIWGTVGQWFSGVGSVLVGTISLWLAGNASRRVRRVEREVIIRSVALSVHERFGRGDDSEVAELVVVNAGSSPIFHVQTPMWTMNSQTGEERITLGELSVLPAGREHRVSLGNYEYFNNTEFRVEATDVFERRWSKTVSGVVTDLTRKTPRWASRKLHRGVSAAKTLYLRARTFLRSLIGSSPPPPL